ncbi:hypothetical protein DV532_28560 (plasmid) [Pseudomonas sp. Leaf58]|uniref:hypothetical protein n=1 Tax=Pseudomonas sp. Leaf58 TaxID=1736226 RepID=UPI0007013835|nr:hypothetical protein [Pseudomonas sp. Leaf58]AYG48222.1 hypothetical protein DV532_28560 [Pseudomonas sp. Leaf58]
MSAPNEYESLGLSLLDLCPPAQWISENDALVMSSEFLSLVEDAVEMGSASLDLIGELGHMTLLHSIRGKTVVRQEFNALECSYTLAGLYMTEALASGVDLADVRIKPCGLLLEEKLSSGVNVRLRCVVQAMPDKFFLMCRILRLPN